jgi:hypothetical protein
MTFGLTHYLAAAGIAFVLMWGSWMYIKGRSDSTSKHTIEVLETKERINHEAEVARMRARAAAERVRREIESAN